jgi:hypothetical protein
MRASFAVVASVVLTGCLTGASATRPNTVFPPGGDEGATHGAAGENAPVWVLEHQIAAHPGCYGVMRSAARGDEGIVRCDDGELRWKATRDVAEAVDDFDDLKSAMGWDAHHDGSSLDDKEVTCTLAGTPASCHIYAFTPHDGSPAKVVIVGMAQLERRGMVAQCFARPGKAEAMKPVCHEVFEVK